jgi:hypothetical protein
LDIERLKSVLSQVSAPSNETLTEWIKISNLSVEMAWLIGVLKLYEVARHDMLETGVNRYEVQVDV